MARVDDLLRPLTPDQQAVVDCVAEAFSLDEEWPFYDYIEGTFDQANKDAAEILASFPRIGRWNYGAVWWEGLGQRSQPNPDGEVALTLLGMHHSKSSADLIKRTFEVIARMVVARRSARLDRRGVRDVTINDATVQAVFARNRVINPESASSQVYKALTHEPYIGTHVPFPTVGEWTMSVPREIGEYEGVDDIEDYMSRVERLTAYPAAPRTLAVSSPLDLVAALDYLDAIWRVTHKEHLFSYPSAERTSKLTHGANTSEEFDSRLSALGEILRSANRAAKMSAGRKLAPASREAPLAPFEDYLTETLDDVGAARARQSVSVLEHALAIRDAAQHTEAGERAARALAELAIPYPVPSIPQAWATVTTEVVEALGAIREELAALAPQGEVADDATGQPGDGRKSTKG